MLLGTLLLLILESRHACCWLERSDVIKILLGERVDNSTHGAINQRFSLDWTWWWSVRLYGRSSQEGARHGPHQPPPDLTLAYELSPRQWEPRSTTDPVELPDRARC